MDQESVEYGEADERDSEDEEDVEPGMKELLEDSTAAELRQIASDVDDILGHGDLHSPVLEELGKVEEDAGCHEGGNDHSSPLHLTERFCVEGVAYHDVAIHRERQREPDGSNLESERGRMQVGKQIRVDASDFQGPVGVHLVGDLHVLDQQGKREQIDEEVCHCQSSQVCVRGSVHRPSGQHHHGDEVADESEAADHHRSHSHQIERDQFARVPVVGRLHLVERVQHLAAVLVELVVRCRGCPVEDLQLETGIELRRQAGTQFVSVDLHPSPMSNYSD